MIQMLRNSLLTFSLLNLVVLGAYAYSEEPNTTAGESAAAIDEPLNDVIAKVGDQAITYGELRTSLKDMKHLIVWMHV